MQICGYRSNSLLAHLCTIDQGKRKFKLGFPFPWCPDHCFGKWWGSCSYSCCLWKRSPNLCVILPWKTDFSISVFSCILYVCLKKMFAESKWNLWLILSQSKLNFPEDKCCVRNNFLALLWTSCLPFGKLFTFLLLFLSCLATHHIS